MKWGVRFLLATWGLLPVSLWAGVATDGSLGAATTLTGSDYQVGANLGTQVGGNLFHSFNDFSIQSNETVTFSGSDSVNNIIGRVTGGNASIIDGTVRSTIPDADLYLVNPNGLVFDKNARLDVQGSFHATTANKVELGDGGKFSAVPSVDDVLTTAPLSAFGFLTKTPAGIQIKSQDIAMATGKGFQLTGGDVDLSIEALGRAGISTSGGDIGIVSVGDAGAVKVVNGHSSLGDVAGGKVSIRDNARLTANTSSASNAGNIRIQADSLEIADQAKLNSDTRGAGNAGNITFESNAVSMSGNTDVSTNSFADGNAGKITIHTKKLDMRDKTFISSNIFLGKGSSGAIHVAADTLAMQQDATMSTTAHQDTSGDAGNITVNAKTLTISGLGETDGDGDPAEDSALITSNTLANSTGKGGTITVNAENVHLSKGGTIAVASKGSGNAGDININVGSRLTSDNGYISSNASTADGGNIHIQGARLVALKDSNVAASVAGGLGDGGNVSMINTTFVTLNNSHVSADSKGSRGGKLDIPGKVIRTPESTTTAKGAETALDGEVLIGEEVNPSDALNELKIDFLTNEIKEPCSAQIANNESYLKIKHATNFCEN